MNQLIAHNVELKRDNAELRRDIVELRHNITTLRADASHFQKRAETQPGQTAGPESVQDVVRGALPPLPPLPSSTKLANIAASVALVLVLIQDALKPVDIIEARNLYIDCAFARGSRQPKIQTVVALRNALQPPFPT
jgi:hypothetical protein